MDAVRDPDEILNVLSPPAAAELCIEAFLLALGSPDPAPREQEPEGRPLEEWLDLPRFAEK
jgi:hypothetical protein